MGNEPLSERRAARHTAGRLLLSRLRLGTQPVDSIVVTSPRRTIPIARVVESLVSAFGAADADVASYALAGPDDAAVLTARTLLRERSGRVVLEAPGVLDVPEILLLAIEADAVILVARRGHTLRRDLEIARRELESAGARLSAAVLLA